jgi:hypothetical protein
VVNFFNYPIAQTSLLQTIPLILMIQRKLCLALSIRAKILADAVEHSHCCRFFHQRINTSRLA